MESKVESNIMNTGHEDEGGPVPISGRHFARVHPHHPLLEDGGHILGKVEWIMSGRSAVG